jgi:hypothetical protein
MEAPVTDCTRDAESNERRVAKRAAEEGRGNQTLGGSCDQSPAAPSGSDHVGSDLGRVQAPMRFATPDGIAAHGKCWHELQRQRELRPGAGALDPVPKAKHTLRVHGSGQSQGSFELGQPALLARSLTAAALRQVSWARRGALGHDFTVRNASNCMLLPGSLHTPVAAG